MRDLGVPLVSAAANGHYDVVSVLLANKADVNRKDLHGQTALAWVRSRHYTEVCDGVERTDPTGDLGRVQRQQAFLRTVLAEAGASRNPLTLMRIGSSLTDGLRIDDEMSMFDAMRLAWGLRGLEPEPLALTTTNDRNEAGAVLILDEEGSQPALDAVR